MSYTFNFCTAPLFDTYRDGEHKIVETIKRIKRIISLRVSNAVTGQYQVKEQELLLNTTHRVVDKGKKTDVPR